MNKRKIFQAFEKMMEPGQEAEPGTINLTVTADMTREQVVEAIKKSVQDVEDNLIKLLDGPYRVNEAFFQSMRISGNDIKFKDAHELYDVPVTMAYGDMGTFNKFDLTFTCPNAFLGEASSKITDMIGKCRYNIKLDYVWEMGELDENGEKKVCFLHIQILHPCTSYFRK